MHAERKGNALPFRIASIVLWVLGIAAEVLAILTANRTLFLPGLSQTTWIIVFLVVDLVLVVVGSQLWKRANHLDPASKENKVAYWVQTELGVIIAVIAFAPVILLMLNNKDLDPKAKKLCSIVAGVALVAAVGSGIDYHPTSQEDLDQAQAGAAVLSDDGLAYWTPFGKKYHFNPDCQYLKNSGTIYSGSVQDAIDAGRNEGCSGCTVEDGTDVLANADPEAVKAALENVVSIGGETGGGDGRSRGRRGRGRRRTMPARSQQEESPPGSIGAGTGLLFGAPLRSSRRPKILRLRRFAPPLSYSRKACFKRCVSEPQAAAAAGGLRVAATLAVGADGREQAGMCGIDVFRLVEQGVRVLHFLVRGIIPSAAGAFAQREQAALGRLGVVGEVTVGDEPHGPGRARLRAAAAPGAVGQVERPHQQPFVLVYEDADGARVAGHGAGGARDAAAEIVMRLADGLAHCPSPSSCHDACGRHAASRPSASFRGGIVVGPGSGSGTVVRGHFPLRFLRATHGHARLLDGFEPPVAHQVGQRAFVHQRERLRGARHDAPRPAGHLRAQVAR